MRKYYAVWNHYGNDVVGYELLHVFDSKKERDEWENDDEYDSNRGGYHKRIVGSDFRDVRSIGNSNRQIKYFLHEHGMLYRIFQTYDLVSKERITESGEEIGKATYYKI